MSQTNDNHLGSINLANSLEEKKKQDEDKRKQEYYKQIEIVVNSSFNTLSRYRKLGNTAIRHMMLIDKLYLILDIGLGALEAVDDIPPQLKEKIDKLVTETKKDLSDLSDWIMAEPSNSRNSLKDDNDLSENTEFGYFNKNRLGAKISI